MRVRIWMSGADGPSHDFEMVDPPRVGERISIAVDGGFEDGVVAEVAWQLLGIERRSVDLPLDAEPIGSVSMVHVICRPDAPAKATRLRAATSSAEVHPPATGNDAKG